MTYDKRFASKLAVMALALAGLGLSPAAVAGDAVVSPLVAKNVDPLVLLNMTSLISSELDFMDQFGEVKQLDMLPAGMNAGCLGSPSCLGKVAKANGSSALIAGALTGRGRTFDIFLVYYDGGRIVRKKSFTLPNTPSVIADSVGPYVKELVTGTSARQEAEAASLGDFDAVSAVDLLDEAEDFEIDPRTTRSGGFDDLPEFEDPDERAARLAAERQAEEEARRAREEEARRQAEEARLAEERRRAREEEARRQAEEARLAEERRRAREQEDQRIAAASRASISDDDLGDITFGSAASEITVEEITFSSAVSMIQVEEGGDDAVADDFDIETSSRTRSSRSDALEGLDAPRRSTSRTASSAGSSRDSTSRRTSSSSRDSSASRSSRDSSSRRSEPSRDRDGARSSRARSYEDMDDIEPATVKSRRSSSSSSSSGSRYRELEEPKRSSKSEYSDSLASLTGRVGFAPSRR